MFSRYTFAGIALPKPQQESVCSTLVWA